MTDPKLQKAYQEAEEKRRRRAITADRDTIPMDFGAPEPFDPIDNPGSYAEDPIWKDHAPSSQADRRWSVPDGRHVDA